MPVENIDILSRYGSESDGVALDRLGGEAWQRRKSRMKERIREIAGELIKTAAIARHPPRRRSPSPTPAIPHFVDRFPYEETEDQDRAIDDVLDDLAAGKPMDRLVCGDVGFGKTEVALRAAFVAAMAGHPGRADRARPPCSPASITRISSSASRASRSRSAGCRGWSRRPRRRRPRKASKTGKVDIVIGTHALLAKVDQVQEARPGHRRRGAAFRRRPQGAAEGAASADVHVLTLTATPIPRTLQMAMSGLRELSVIQTPPVDRLAVRTYVMPWDPVVVREALLREHYRGGQSFFVVPRIADLPDIEELLREEVPEVKAVTAHGQMAPTEVEERMSAFYDRKYDVLLSTTIVESGLDIPSANTLIVHRADRFGLAQLYQLRGRVGRAKTRAYAYLTTPPDRHDDRDAPTSGCRCSPTSTASAPASSSPATTSTSAAPAICSATSSRATSRRSASSSTSRCSRRRSSRRRRAARSAREEFSPQISVDAPILIPEDYVPDLDLRMGLYRRLGELEDRAGDRGLRRRDDRPLRHAARRRPRICCKIIEIKINCRAACIAKLDVGAKGAVVTFLDDGFPDLAGLLAYVERLKGTARLRPDSKLVISRDWPTGEARLNGALQIVARAGAGGRGGRESEGAGAGLGGLGHGWRHEARQLGLVERAGAEEALVEVAAPVGEQGQLRGGLDAFDDDLQLELAGQADHRPDDDPVARAADDVGDQPAVDLERVERQAGQIGEAGIAGAEIVDRDRARRRRAAAPAARRPSAGRRAGCFR